MADSHDSTVSEQRIVVGLGELLWDELPGGRRLGGAPANFALMATQLGDRGIVASRVGADDSGGEARHLLSKRGLDTSYVQSDEAQPTGTVQVRLDVGGQPDYVITESVAWDYLEWTPQWEELASQADAVCFGTLAQRANVSLETIRRFLRTTRANCLRTFDVNLRQSFYSADILAESLDLATVVKLNHEELPRVAGMLGLGGRGENAWAHRLIQVFDLEMVCVTRGANGSLLITPTDLIESPGLKVNVADTIGAGDAFTAALVHCYLRQTPLEKIGEVANQLGAWVATQAGAMPVIDDQVLTRLICSPEN
ncbi:MAG: carbohydrate kinase [Pyrinomonadaceae bacterium]|nr:carbohydrate kinase [Pyrinomonadaceae bacterium]